MRYKHFKNANVDVSALSVGTWATGSFGYGDVKDDESVQAIRAMVDGGVNLIDTAPVYGDGHSELVVGEAIKTMDRDKIFLSTKFGVGITHARYKRAEIRGEQIPEEGLRDATYANVLYECEQSLRRLGTDYLDFYFVHWPDYDTPFAETMEALNTLKKEGKIRFIGLSNFDKDQILECEQTAQIDVIQPPYSMVVRRDEELMKWCVERGIDTFTYGSLGAGILTGTFREPPTFHPGDPRNGFYPFFVEPHFSKVMKVLDVMDEISAEIGKSLPQIAINWATQRDFVSTALCGVRTVAEAQDNCSTFDWQLDDAQMARLNEAVETYIDFDGSAPLK